MQRFYATNYGMGANALEISVFRLLATQPDCRMQKTLRLLKNVWPKINDGSIKPMVRQIIPLEKAAEAHALMESATHLGKIMLKVN